MDAERLRGVRRDVAGAPGADSSEKGEGVVRKSGGQMIRKRKKEVL